jgi:hypothetical protein
MEITSEFGECFESYELHAGADEHPLKYDDLLEHSSRYLCAIAPDIFCIFCVKHLGVFRLPAIGGLKLSTSISRTGLNLPILEPIWLYNYDGKDVSYLWNNGNINIYIRTFRLDEESTHIELATEKLTLILRIPLAGSAVQVLEARIPLAGTDVRFDHALAGRKLVAFKPLATHFCAVSYASSNGFNVGRNVRMDLIPRPLLPGMSSMAELRLGSDTMPALAMLLRTTGACQPLSVSYDVWSRVAIVAWKDRRRDMHVTTWSFDRLLPECTLADAYERLEML